MIRLRVKEIAQAKGISQRKLSKLSGLDDNHIRRIYHNPYYNITMETLNRLAEALGVDASELIESVPPEEP